MGMLRLCSLSVDLDEIHHYYSIHADNPGEGREVAWNAVYDCSLIRFEQFAQAEGLPLTLFAVASDLSRKHNADKLRSLVAKGHELGNHTLEHCYDLTRQKPGAIFFQIDEANERFEQQVGTRPVGFRAPGYCINGDVYAALEQAGMLYSSSVFPCPYYYGAKAVALGLIGLRGGKSSSIVDDPRVLLAPTKPYRVGAPYWRKGAGFVEMPIQVTPRLRMPFFGTVISLGGVALATRMARSLVGQPLINLELHGVDLLDKTDGLQDLAKRQRDLRVPLSRKREALCAVVKVFRDAGYEFVQLQEAAERLFT